MFKNKKFSLLGLLFNIIVGVVIGMLLYVNPLIAAAVWVIAGCMVSFLPIFPSGAIRSGVLKEIWIDVLKENFYPDTSFLVDSTDMSDLVEHNAINLAECGADPNVLIDNATFPIPMSERVDAPIRLPLRVLDTESTWVRNIEEMQTAYNKMESVISQHRNVLRTKSAELAAWNWAASTDTTFTPVKTASGGNNGGGLKRLLFEDIIGLETRFNEAEIPYEDRIIVLTPQHQADLQVQDINLYKSIMSGSALFGFKVRAFSRNPLFNITTGAKVPFGTALASGFSRATFAYAKSEVMRADGTVDMFYKEKDPDYKGDIINFQKAFVALPFRNKGIAAIYSPAVPST